ncbi:hypothetical protein BC835DRAFT_1381944 [Cytidiella melzeri]|nr:hypothetical protein BC835DRAFT_1381944 [Cytidiella melzeri]
MSGRLCMVPRSGFFTGRTKLAHGVYRPNKCWWVAKVEAQITSPFSLSIRTPRLVGEEAPIWDLIKDADINGVRELLSSAEASVYDVDKEGRTVLLWAHHAWRYKRQSTESGPDRLSYDTIKFLADAGADLELCVGTNWLSYD